MQRRVLVVDDDAAFRRLMSSALTAWGYEVAGEASGFEDALVRAAALRPDTVMVDVALGDGNGFDLTKRLLELDWPMRVVLVSSDADNGNRVAALRAGARGFVPKSQLSGAVLDELFEEG